ncbi:outer membrane lipid asymmetry maintenance protein MlaD [Rickettsiales bacterium]|nr:outer membrane lipid asymmetry maintenance protein MlaD [Rickettsiales bacterium]
MATISLGGPIKGVNMRDNLLEVLVGLTIILLAAYFLFFAYSYNNANRSQVGYKVVAEFTNANGLNKGSDVRISGVKVGTVIEKNLNINNHLARVVILLEPDMEVPVDSSVSILTDGIFGAKYANLVPGSDKRLIKEGESIAYTQSTIDIESILAKFFFGRR